MKSNSTFSEHWKVLKLKDVGQIVSGGTPSTKTAEYWGNDIGWITPADLSGYQEKYISRGRKSISEAGLKNSSAKLMPKGSVLFSSRAPIGYVVIASNNLSTNQGFKSIIPNETVYNEYLYYFLKASKNTAENVANGTTFKEISLKSFAELPIPLPPLPEQQEIVAKIEELFSELDKGKEQLETARQQLKVYHQAVLKWAFEGKFTNLEVKAGELPVGWQWIKLGEVTEKIFDGPFGSNLKSKDYIDEGVRVIRLENIGPLEFRDEHKTYVSEEKYETISKHTVSAGDIIFSSFIMDEIRVVALPKFIERAINKADCFCVRANREVVDERYIAYYLSTKQVYNQLVNEVHGATRPRINTTQLKSCMLPLPSIEEQNAIVQEIESRLSVCDKVEETISNSLRQAETLRQSILKQAFEGKLLKAESKGVTVKVNQLNDVSEKAKQYQITFD